MVSEYKREEGGRKQGAKGGPSGKAGFTSTFARHLKGGALASSLLLEQEGVFPGCSLGSDTKWGRAQM